MADRVYLVEDGYAIRGGAPPGLRRQPPPVREMFWGWVLMAGLRQKDRDLAKGLDKDGKPLRRISAYTRKHRHSEMTPSGRGDPSAPPLEPGRQLSRTRSLLTGRAFPDRAEFWWRFDPFTGDSWARVLYYQKEQGRDVFGLSPAALRRTMAYAWDQYKKWEAGKAVEMPGRIEVPMAGRIEAIGSTDLRSATMGINVPKALGEWSGGLRIEEWIARMRESAPATVPGRPSGPYNRLLRHIWGDQGPPGQPPQPPPKPPPKKPRPPRQPRPKATPRPPERRPAWGYNVPLEPGRPIGERIAAAAHLEGRRAAIAAALGGAEAEIGRLRAAQEAIRSRMEAFVADANARGITDPAEIIRLGLGALDVEHDAALDALFAARRRLREEAARKVEEALEVPADLRATWDHRDGPGFGGKAANVATRADVAAWLRAKTAGGAATPIEIAWESRPGARAYASRSDSAIVVKDDESPGTMAHEMGHHIEYRLPGVLRAAQEFLAHRVGNQPLRPLKDVVSGAFDADEMGRDDDFAKAFGVDEAWYVGKHYDGLTEIVAMGVEKLYNDPAGFAKNDPEYFKFVLGILDGTLRSP